MNLADFQVSGTDLLIILGIIALVVIIVAGIGRRWP